MTAVYEKADRVLPSSTPITPSSGPPAVANNSPPSPGNPLILAKKRTPTKGYPKFDAFCNTLYPPQSKGIKYGLDLCEKTIALTRKVTSVSSQTTQFASGAGLAKGFISIPFVLGPLKYFVNLKENKEATRAQAAGMGFVLAINALSTFNFLEQFGIRTISRIAFNIGTVPVINYLFPALGIGIGACMLKHEHIKWPGHQEKCRINRLEREMWMTRNIALDVFRESTKTLEDVQALQKAGAAQQRDLDAIWKARINELPLKARGKMVKSHQLERGNDWAEVVKHSLLDEVTKRNSPPSLQVKATKTIKLYTPCSIKGANVSEYDAVDFLSKRITDERKRCRRDRKNNELYRQKAYINVAISVLEIAYSILSVIGLVTGIGALALSSPLLLILGSVVHVVNLYQLYHYFNKKEQPPVTKSLEGRTDSEGFLMQRDLLVKHSRASSTTLTALTPEERAAFEAEEERAGEESIQAAQNADTTGDMGTVPYSAAV